MTEHEAEHEYIELMLDVKNGEIVSCEFFGEGRQVEPLTEPVILKPLDCDGRGWKRIERRIRQLFRAVGECERND